MCPGFGDVGKMSPTARRGTSLREEAIEVLHEAAAGFVPLWRPVEALVGERSVYEEDGLLALGVAHNDVLRRSPCVAVK